MKMTELAKSSSSVHGFTPLAESNNYLGVRLHRLLAEEKGNVFFSPFCASSAMAMLLCGAEGETASELRSALGYDEAEITEDEIVAIFEEQVTLLMDNPELSSATAMLVNVGLDLKDGYKKIVKESFKAWLLEVDFQKEGENAVNQINEWVREKTGGILLKSFVPSAAQVLLNAAYFRGTWLEQFEEESTYPEKFYIGGNEDNSKEVDMMHMSKSFHIYENPTLQALQLPYAGEKMAMLILLPRAIDGLEPFEAELKPLCIKELILKAEIRKEKVNVTLPRFKVECTRSLVSCFQELGVKKVFSASAQLGNASDSPDLQVSEILHKAVLQVNEEGSQAATDTFVKSSEHSTFTADHPFAFVIFDTINYLFLFMGRVNEI